MGEAYTFKDFVIFIDGVEIGRGSGADLVAPGLEPLDLLPAGLEIVGTLNPRPREILFAGMDLVADGLADLLITKGDAPDLRVKPWQRQSKDWLQREKPRRRKRR